MEKHAMCKQGDDLKLSLFSELPPQYFFFSLELERGFVFGFFVCLSAFLILPKWVVLKSQSKRVQQ